MNREIKFRAWDKKNKQWLFGYELPNLGGFSLMGEVMMMGEWAALLSNRFPNDVKEIAVMQWTGLKGEGGKEIYEGDLLRFSDGTVREVGFKTGMFGAGVDFNFHQIQSDCEIIGNIHENPELLTHL